MFRAAMSGKTISSSKAFSGLLFETIGWTFDSIMSLYSFRSRIGTLCLVTLGWMSGARAAEMDASLPDPTTAPFWSGTILRSKNHLLAAKGLAIPVGKDRLHFVVYDMDTLRLSAAWGGPFLEFGNTLTKIEWPPPPSIRGDVTFETADGPGWAAPDGTWKDPRSPRQGPLPKSWVHYQGLYISGESVVLKYSVGAATLLETPDWVGVDTNAALARTWQSDRALAHQQVLLVSGVQSPIATDLNDSVGWVAVALAGGKPLYVSGANLPAGTRLESTQDGQLVLMLSSVPAHHPFSVFLSSGNGATRNTLAASLPRDLRSLTLGGTPRWGAPISTVGVRSAEEGPYVVDTITEPVVNPYHSRLYFGGFDFLPDGRAVICTFHGDVWLVSGIDDGLSKLSWKRFATGLFQPLGVKVDAGRIYVAGRDQITRLTDLNNDGEADFYENFNNDTVVTPNYHEFVLDLHTDSKGNFYYAKGAPWEPAVTSPHQGTLLKVSPDGGKLEVVATGLRAPNGMTVGPDDTILISDNQGHWMPSSKLNLVKPGSFLGMVPSAQKEIQLRYPDGREITVNPSDPEARKKYGLKGWEGAMPIPARYDEPVCWLPMRWDNSSGGQTYVTSDRWGPWKGAPLFLSYGKCLLYGVLWDEFQGTTQASMVPFNLKFQSGVMRARFSERDGQLYVCGLKGWQNAATREGGFYRVRYTGKPVRMPIRAHATQTGVEVDFTTELEAASATDPGNFAVELWNYHYSGNYGSPEVSVLDPRVEKHDSLEVKSVKLSADKKKLFIEVAGLQPADQFSIRYNVKAADGTELKSELIGTIHKLGTETAANLQ